MKTTIRKGEPCILVYDNNNCVGVVFEHYESRIALANGQAEIRFFEKFYNEYGKWHRIRINEQRLSYKRLKENLLYGKSIAYSGYIIEK